MFRKIGLRLWGTQDYYDTDGRYYLGMKEPLKLFKKGSDMDRFPCGKSVVMVCRADWSGD